MKPSDKCYELIKQFEDFRENAFYDTDGIPTIGYGTIRYHDGSKVAIGDKCTTAEALEWLKSDVEGAVGTINRLSWNMPLNQAQFDSMVSFQYSTGALSKSVLYQKAKINTDDETIRDEFMRWVRDSGKVVQKLVNRRKQEADLYFSFKKEGDVETSPANQN